MDLKYRIRLQNGRVIGPFSTEEIGELFTKAHINGTEMCQQFPIGDWKPLQTFVEITNFLTKKPTVVETPQQEKSSPGVIESKEVKPVTKATRTNLTAPRRDDSNIKSFTEFKFGKNIKIDVNYAELEKKYQAENPDSDYEEGVGKTVVLRRVPVKKVEVDKTTVVKHSPPPVEKKVEVVEEEQTRAVEIKREIVPPLSYEELINEKTQFINLSKDLAAINAQLSVSEVELEKQAKIEENQEKKRLRELQEIMLREQAIEDGVEEDEVEVVEEYSKEKKEFEQKVVVKKKNKGMSIIAILAFLGVFYFFLMPEDKPKSLGIVYVDVKFPITSAYDNEVAANTALAEARNLYSQGDYRRRALASGFYLNSLQNKFAGNESMGEIIMTYAEILENTRDKNQAGNTLYKYIQLSESKLLSDPFTVTGTANFYGKIGKYQTGIYTIKNYLRAGNKPTPKMLSYYLELLVSAGEFVEARSAYEALLKIPKKPFESYYSLAQFNIADDKPTEAKTILEEGLKYYPGSVLLLLQYGDLLLQEQAVKKFEETLNKVAALEAEGSPIFMASYFRQKGYLSAYKNKNEEASKLFKRSLAIKESEDLRATLSKLEIGGDQLAQTLILESKVIGLLKKAKTEYKNKNFDTAFQFAIEAVDGNPDYIPAVLFLAQMNADRGFFEAAIVALQKIISVHPQNYQLKRMLIETYIKSFKFEDAERLLGELAQTKYSTTTDYASLMGQFSEARKSPVLALKWYDRALARDPLNDSVMFKVSKILVKNRRYPEARSRLSKALLLDPKNVAYHALYAEILYEQDGTDTAIGYLRDILSEIGDDPILISAIATAYFKSGQLKEFQTYYKKVQNLPKKDESFYEVLIAAALLEGRKDEYIQHSRDLLKLNPGNLKVRMDLGELLYDEKRFDEAIEEFTEIKNKLESYPKVHYQLARVYLAKNDLEKAREMAQKELDLNPKLDSAHFIMGEVHRINKEYREAIARYENAISLNTKSVEGLVAMASVKLAQNYANEALELLNRAVKEDLTNPQIHKLLGDAYRAAGQRALAKEKYEDYLKIYPTAPDKDQIESQIRNLK